MKAMQHIHSILEFGDVDYAKLPCFVRDPDEYRIELIERRTH